VDECKPLVVGAMTTGAKFVERAQHVDICTPHVRAAATYTMVRPATYRSPRHRMPLPFTQETRPQMRWPGKYCSPRHRMPFDAIHEVSNCVSLICRAVSVKSLRHGGDQGGARHGGGGGGHRGGGGAGDAQRRRRHGSGERHVVGGHQRRCIYGGAVQVEPQPLVESARLQRLKLKYDKLLSTLGLNFNLRPYKVARHVKFEVAERTARTLPDKKKSGAGAGDKTPAAAGASGGAGGRKRSPPWAQQPAAPGGAGGERGTPRPPLAPTPPLPPLAPKRVDFAAAVAAADPMDVEDDGEEELGATLVG